MSQLEARTDAGARARNSDACQEQVEQPDKLLRIAATLQTLLTEIRTVELDEQGRIRLADIHDRALEELRAIVSDQLRAELEDMDVAVNGVPSGPELRVAHAQLVGWMQGLIHGIQASIVSQQLISQREALQQQRQQALQQAHEQERLAAERYL